jgi:hypothetical protein
MQEEIKKLASQLVLDPTDKLVAENLTSLFKRSNMIRTHPYILPIFYEDLDSTCYRIYYDSEKDTTFVSIYNNMEFVANRHTTDLLCLYDNREDDYVRWETIFLKGFDKLKSLISENCIVANQQNNAIVSIVTVENTNYIKIMVNNDFNFHPHIPLFKILVV